MPTPNLRRLLADKWSEGESATKAFVSDLFPEASETFITEYLIATIRRKLREVSEKGLVAKAFAQDIRRWSLENYSVSFKCSPDAIASGLFAEIIPHNLRREGVTGGDFGLVYSRPAMEFKPGEDRLVLPFVRDGLLVQAKRQDKDGAFGGFTPNQEVILPDAVRFLGLYLYSREVDDILSFGWIAGKGLKFSDFKGVLKGNESNAPALRSSARVLRDLEDGSIGTDDEKIIEEQIGHAGLPSFELRIDWPDGKTPDPPKAYVHMKAEVQEVIHVRH